MRADDPQHGQQDYAHQQHQGITSGHWRSLPRLPRILPALVLLLALCVVTLSASVTDDFNRADGSLGGNWTALVGSFSITSNKVEGSGAQWSFAKWAGHVFSDAQSAQVTLNTPFGAPAIRLSGTGATTAGYLVYADGNNSKFNVMEITAGVPTNIADRGNGVSAAGDTLMLTGTGDTLQVWFNGVKQGADIDASAHSHPTGSAGIATYTISLGFTSVDDFIGTGEGAPVVTPHAGLLTLGVGTMVFVHPPWVH